MLPVQARHLTRSMRGDHWGYLRKYGRIYVLSLIEMLSRGIIRLIVPLAFARMGASVGVIGMLTPLPDFVQAVLRIPGGALAGHWGERRVLVAALATSVAAGGAYLLAPGIWWFSIPQILFGLSLALFVPARWSYVVNAPERWRATAISHTQVVLDIGHLMSPLLAGLVMDAFGLRAGFILYAALAVAALPVVKRLPDLSPQSIAASTSEALLKSFAMSRRLLAESGDLRLAFASQMLLAATRGMLAAFYPLYVTRLGFPASAVGFLFACQGLAGILPRLLYPTLSRRVGVRHWLVWGSLLMGASLFTTPWLRSFPLLLLGMILSGFGDGIAAPAGLHIAAGRGGAVDASLRMGVWSTSFAVGTMLGPLIFGQVAQALGLAVAFWAANGLVLVGMPVIVLSGYGRDR